ncbi:kinetochore-associated protein 1-like isoform X2 [Halichondria panicea]|uniref:kinetochore-associated protein 1-like isoform X2 n=1 Tax=Halichondria panicea TaxID=6063 RepID=UPI00312B872E
MTGGHSLYEANVVSTLPGHGSDKGKFGVLGPSTNHLCVVTDDHVQIATLSVSSPLQPAVYKFECQVDCVGWSEKESLLVVADRNGVLHFVSPSLQEVLFSQDVGVAAASDQEKVFSSVQFSNSRESELSSLYVLLSMGVVLIFKNLPFNQLSEAIRENDLQLMKQLKDDIVWSRHDISAEHDTCSSFLLPLATPTPRSPASFVTTGCGASGLCVWRESGDSGLEIVDCVSCLLKGVCIARCEVTRNDKYLVTLCSTGSLAVWSLHSLVMVNLWTSGQVVKDLSLCATAGLEGGSDQACLLTENSSGGTTLILASLPGLHALYSQEVSSTAALVHGTVTEDCVYYTELEGGSVVVRQLVQALPEKRLATLIGQGRFDDAETLAKKFNLDPELVYKTKAQVLNSVWINKTIAGEEAAEVHTNLLQCVKCLQDGVFVAELFLSSQYPTLTMTLDTLHLAKNKLKNDSEKSGEIKSAQLKVFSALNKIVTFQMVHSQEEFCPRSWHCFLLGSLLDHLSTYFHSGNLNKLALIWNRHMSELMTQLGGNDLVSLLRSLPECIPSAELGAWLSRSVVPFILQHTPQVLPNFLDWAQSRVRLLELSEKEQWPQNGLKLCDYILEAVSCFKNPLTKMALRTTSIILEDSVNPDSSVLSGLKCLQGRLRDLCYLETILCCSLSLAEHEKDTRKVVVFRLLDKAVAAELVSTTILHKVAPYVQRHGLDLDTVLLSYVKLFLSQSPRFSTSLTDSPYEAKAITLVHAIKDKELYVTGCIEVLKYVRTPWSESVEELVQRCLKVDHPHVAMLEKQYQLLQLKKLLHGYGIKDVNFSDTASSLRWLYIRRILSSDEPASLEDAMKVADMYHLCPTEVYKIHVFNLGMNGKIITASEVLRGLSRTDLIATAVSVFQLASNKLQLPFQNGVDDPEEHISATSVALLCLSLLKETGCHEDCVLSEDWINIDATISLYEQLLSLQVKYSVFLSPNSLADKEACDQLFQKRVNDFADSLCLHENSPKLFHAGSRFASLLGYTEQQFSESVAAECARRMDLKQAKTIWWDLLRGSPDSFSSALLLYTVQQGWALMQSDPGSVSGREIKELRDLAAQAMTIADTGVLLSAVEVYSGCILLCELHSQCEGAAPDLEVSESEPAGITSGVPAHFREDGLVLDQQKVLPAAVKFVQARTPLLTSLETRLLPTAFSGDTDVVLELSSELSQALQDNGHIQLSVLCTMQTLPCHCGYAGVTTQTLLETEQKTLSGMLLTLTGKVLSSRKLDHEYALSLLLMLPPQVAAQKLQGIRFKSISSYSRVISLCNLALDYGCITNQTQLSKQAGTIRSSAEWGKRLSKVKISFTEAFRGGNEEKMKVTTTLFRSNLADIETVLQYTGEVLGSNPQSVLLAYLRVVLTEWAESEAWLDRAASLLGLITNSHELLASILSSKVSPYDYERITFILQNLVNGEQVSGLKIEQGLLLLDCLRCYSRGSLPSEAEKNWYSSHYLQPSNSTEPTLHEVQLPPQATDRLPFHCLLYASPMDIIGPELSASTISKLIPIAKILKLDGDDFYSLAIKNIASSSCDSGVTISPSKTRFGSLADLLVHIKNTNLALSITKWLAKQLHTDEERVAALKTAVSIANNWKEQARTESNYQLANEKLQMFTTLLKITQTDQLLHQYGLGDLKELSAQGALLVIKLFTDVPVSKQQPVPEVHSLAAEIARVHRISLDKIKAKLTETWLTTSKAESKDMDITQMSLMEDPTEESDGESEDDLNFKRLKYLLNVPDQLEASVTTLLQWAKHTVSSSIGNLSRVKALQVLFAIAPDSLIQSVSGTSVSDVREYMQCTLFAAELERLHMSTSMPAFQACSKEGLVKSLWRNHSQEPRALRLIGELCLHYSIKDGSLWSKLLQALFKLGMLPYLRHVLKTLSSCPDQLWDIQIMPSLWEHVILFPFQDASAPLSVFQQDECAESLRMLMGCPFLFELDVTRISGAFHSVGLLDHALVATLVMSREQNRQDTIKSILDKMSPESLVTFLNNVGNSPAVSDYKLQVEELVYLYVNSSERHQVLVGSDYFTSYVYFLVTRKMVDGLLIKSLQANMISEAIRLVELYNQHYSVSTLSGLELLKEYIETRNLSELNNFIL